MLDQMCDPRLDQSWIPSSAWRRLRDLQQERIALQKVDFADDVPVMLETVLALELLLREPCLDLRMASEIVLSDVGATIKLLGLFGKEFDFVTQRPNRMGDCIAGLDVGHWFNAISAQTIGFDSDHSATTGTWKHCRLVAQYAQLVAESLDGISATDAYLVGLLHEVGAIATVLGWPTGDPGNRGHDVLLAIEETLPLFVLAAMRSVNQPCNSSTWRFILTAAHELAGVRKDFDPSALRAIDSSGICSRWLEFLPVVANSPLEVAREPAASARLMDEEMCKASIQA